MPSKRVVRESSPQPRVLIYPSRIKLILLSAGALLFVVVGALMIATGSTAIRVLGVAAAAFFGSAFLYLGYRLVKPRPSVIVDRTGIHDRASLACAGFIPWNEIRRYRSHLVGSQPMLAVTVTDPDALLARISPPRRMLMKANHKMAGTPVNIPQIALPMRVDELGKELDAFRSAVEAPDRRRQGRGDSAYW